MQSPKGYNLQLIPCNQRQWQDSCEQSNAGFLIMALMLYRRITILLWNSKYLFLQTRAVFYSCIE